MIFRPEFYVLYNGSKPYPDEMVMKLSEHFKNLRELGLPEKPHPLLELVVKVLNINEGRNEHIVNRYKKLAEYRLFTSRARSFTEEMGNRKKGIKAAIKYCIVAKEILAEAKRFKKRFSQRRGGTQSTRRINSISLS